MTRDTIRTRTRPRRSAAGLAAAALAALAVLLALARAGPAPAAAPVGPVGPAGAVGPASVAGRDAGPDIRPVNVFGTDDRRQEERRRGSDAGRIVLITDPTTNKAGTGFLIAPCFAMSALHVVLSDYDLDVRADPSVAFQYTVYFGSGRRFGTFEDFTIGRPVAWGRYFDAVPMDASQDWILLQLDRCVGERYGHFTPRVLDLAEAGERRLRLAGYPQPNDFRRVQVDPACRVYDAMTWPMNLRPVWQHDCAIRVGASGSPIYYVEDGNSYVVAIAIGELRSTEDVLPAYDAGRANIAVPIANALAALAAVAAETPERIAEAQQLLGAIGRPVGTADGVAGPMTRRAVNAYRTARGLPGSGLISEDLLIALREDAAARHGDQP
jgi:V8-like Glu-specific endopeptidase